MKGLNIAFFGSSLVSAYWNGAATYYRGIIKALHERGHSITFYEPDAYDRQQHRDIPDPAWAKVVVYPGKGESGVLRAVSDAADADVIVKASGVGIFDELLELAVLEARKPNSQVVFWDVDAPATLNRIHGHPRDPFRELIPRYDFIFTYGGGEPVIKAYKELGARQCVPIYNAVDPATHHPVPRNDRFSCDLGFLGNRLPDREARVEEFFLRAATILPQRTFILGGSGWSDKAVPRNVNYLGHIYTRDHNAFNSTPLAVLNISRQSMAEFGFSPATRVFEAAGAKACIITDYWEGIDTFLEPQSEILVAADGPDVAVCLQQLSPERACAIGEAAYARVLAHHTYTQRAEQVDAVLTGHRTHPSPAAVTNGVKHQNGNGNGNGKGKAHSASEQAARKLNIVVLGLTITSSWGNGHATTYRGILRELALRGHSILFLERDKPWYASSRDLPKPPHIRTEIYYGTEDLKRRYWNEIYNADCVIVGSYVPDGVAIGEWVTRRAKGLTAFYDIDTPVTLAKLQRLDYEYLTPELAPQYDLYLSFTGGPTLQRLERELKSPAARPLYCSIDHDQYFPESNLGAPLYDLGYLGTYSQDRQPMLERLLIEPARRSPELNLIVAGPQYPDSVAWSPNITRVEHLPPSSHRDFYNRQRYTLNVTRADMREAGHSPSVRLFEAAACGTPIITDHWEGLETFFIPGEEILIAHSTSDILHFLNDISEGQRKEIARRAREKVLRQHTAAHRAKQLESYIYEFMA
jgi:spore maturation protein CgeB